MRIALLVLAFVLAGPPQVLAQAPPACRFLCAPEFKVEPTVTFTNLFGAPRIAGEQGMTTRERREAEFEVIFSVGLPTRVSWLEFTVEAIFLPFDRESTPEIEFETNFIWLPAERTRGWVSSHFDIVDKFSAAERPTDRRAYTHKLNLELDTSLAVVQLASAGSMASGGRTGGLARLRRDRAVQGGRPYRRRHVPGPRKPVVLLDRVRASRGALVNGVDRPVLKRASIRPGRRR